MEGVQDYTVQLNTIISKLTELIQNVENFKISQDLLFLILAIFLVLYVMRGE